MTCYLWAIISKDLKILGFRVTTDATPTHHLNETWVLIKEFKA